jgi:hypothetical protein
VERQHRWLGVRAKPGTSEARGERRSGGGADGWGGAERRSSDDADG